MSSTRLVTLAAALVAAGVSAGAQTPSSGRTLVAHDFSTSAQGWRVSGDTGTTDPEFHREGGEAGGFISHVDEAVGETWYFRAPDSLLKALSAAENGELSFSLEQSMDGLGFIDDDVIIQGPAGRLSYRFGRAPATDWTQFSVSLVATAGWRWNWNAQATPEQMRRVLANPTSVEIRGEYHTGPDEAGLDNVVLRAPQAVPAQPPTPSPGSAQAVAAGRTPKAAASAVLELVRSTFPVDAREDLTSHTFLASNVDALQRAAQAVIDDDGTDAAAAPRKINLLVHDLTNVANTAVNIAGRPRETPQIKRKFEQFASALRAISAELLAMTLPVSGGNAPASRTAMSDATPGKEAAAAALELAQSTRRDETYVGPRLHTFLLTNLTTLERAAQAVLDDDGRTATATTAKLYALSSALDATAQNAVDISGRPNETAEAKSKSQRLASAARTISARLDAVLRPDVYRLLRLLIYVTWVG